MYQLTFENQCGKPRTPTPGESCSEDNLESKTTNGDSVSKVALPASLLLSLWCLGNSLVPSGCPLYILKGCKCGVQSSTGMYKWFTYEKNKGWRNSCFI